MQNNPSPEAFLMATSWLLPGSHNTVLTENKIDLECLYNTYRYGFRSSTGVSRGAQVWELAAHSVAMRCWDTKWHQGLWDPLPHRLPSSSPASLCSSCMEGINYPPCFNGSREMPCSRMHCTHCSSAEEEEHKAAPHRMKLCPSIASHGQQLLWGFGAQKVSSRAQRAAPAPGHCLPCTSPKVKVIKCSKKAPFLGEVINSQITAWPRMNSCVPCLLRAR